MNKFITGFFGTLVILAMTAAFFVGLLIPGVMGWDRWVAYIWMIVYICTFIGILNAIGVLDE